MKVYYFNDEKEAVMVRVLHQGSLPDGSISDDYLLLQPAQGHLFEVNSPDDSVPYIKRWQNRLLMISYIRKSDLPTSLTQSDSTL